MVLQSFSHSLLDLIKSKYLPTTLCLLLRFLWDRLALLLHLLLLMVSLRTSLDILWKDKRELMPTMKTTWIKPLPALLYWTLHTTILFELIWVFAWQIFINYGYCIGFVYVNLYIYILVLFEAPCLMVLISCCFLYSLFSSWISILMLWVSSTFASDKLGPDLTSFWHFSSNISLESGLNFNVCSVINTQIGHSLHPCCVHWHNNLWRHLCLNATHSPLFISYFLLQIQIIHWWHYSSSIKISIAIYFDNFDSSLKALFRCRLVSESELILCFLSLYGLLKEFHFLLECFSFDILLLNPLFDLNRWIIQACHLKNESEYNLDFVRRISDILVGMSIKP